MDGKSIKFPRTSIILIGWEKEIVFSGRRAFQYSQEIMVDWADMYPVKQ